MKTVLVCGSSGFIGGHLVKRLIAEGYVVIGADLQQSKYERPCSFYQFDLRDPLLCNRIFQNHNISEVYQLAADMGGAGYIFTGDNDANIMHNSAQINLNIAELCMQYQVEKVFYSSSACMYPSDIQNWGRLEGQYEDLKRVGDRMYPGLKEEDAYPADPDSEYGWEKLFSERLYLAYQRNYNLNVRIARFHNIFGPEGTWDGGKEKAPAAICRKVALCSSEGEIEVWGDGEQTRSFLYIDECIEGVRRLMESDFKEPVNIGSDEMVSINKLVEMVSVIAGKKVTVKHIEGPTGVRGRNSNNELIQKVLGWKPSQSLYAGLEKTYHWINSELNK